MNETVIERPIGLSAAAKPARRRATKTVSEPKVYLLLTLVIIAGYLLRDFGLITPEYGAGSCAQSTGLERRLTQTWSLRGPYLFTAQDFSEDAESTSLNTVSVNIVYDPSRIQ